MQENDGKASVRLWVLSHQGESDSLLKSYEVFLVSVTSHSFDALSEMSAPLSGLVD